MVKQTTEKGQITALLLIFKDRGNENGCGFYEKGLWIGGERCNRLKNRTGKSYACKFSKEYQYWA